MARFKRSLKNRENRGLFLEGVDATDNSIGTAIRDTWRPQACYYKGYIYFTFIAWNGDIYVTKFRDGIENEEAQTILVARRSEDYNATASDIQHGNPAICIDQKGYVHLFYGAHNTPMCYRRSTSPENILNWTSKITIGAASLATYPNPVVLKDNTIFLLYRQDIGGGQKRSSFTKSTDGGNTWSSETVLITPSSTKWIYPVCCVAGDEASGSQSVHILTAVRDDTTKTFVNLNYMYSPDQGTTWKFIDGTTLSLPIDQTAVDVVEPDSSYPADLRLDSQGNRLICFNESGTIKFVKYEGGTWNISTVSTDPENIYEPSWLDIIDDNTLDIYTVDGYNSSYRGGNIVRYRSNDGGNTWAKAEDITTGGGSVYSYAFPQLIFNHQQNGNKLIYCSGRFRTSGLLSPRSHLHTYPFTTNFFKSSRGCVELGGTNGFVRVSQYAKQPIYTNASSITVAIRFYLTGSLDDFLWSLTNGSDNDTILGVRVSDLANDDLLLTIRPADNTPTIQNITIATDLSLLTWYHGLLRVVDNAYEFYIDNVLVASGTFTDIDLLDSNRLSIGALSRITDSGFWAGRWCDFQAYKKALSAEERTTVFNRGYIDDSSFIVGLRGNGNLIDYSGNQNHGIRVNTSDIQFEDNGPIDWSTI